MVTVHVYATDRLLATSQMGGTITPVHLFLVMCRLRSHHGRRRRGRRRNLT
ncbi:hypothetical protein PISMIDRAFT_686146, partial [Pisolithus microcarpus 441]